MDIKLSVNGIETKIGIELAADIATWLPDNENNQDIFHELAQHLSSSVRQGVANKDQISNKTAKLLLRDKDTNVLDNILRSHSVKDIFNEDDFKYILETGSEKVLETLIALLNEYKSIDDTDACFEAIIELNNDYLNLQIANSYSVPRKILKKLLKSEDPDIVNAVKESLE